MSIIIQPTKSLDYGGIQYFIHAKINGVLGRFLVDSGDTLVDGTVVPDFSARAGLDKQHVVSKDPLYNENMVYATIEIENSAPIEGMITLKNGSDVNLGDGLMPAASIARRFSMFFSGQDKTLTLYPTKDTSSTPDDPQLSLKHKPVLAYTDVKINGISTPMVVDTGTFLDSVVIDNTLAKKLNLAIKGPNITLQIGDTIKSNVKSTASPNSTNMSKIRQGSAIIGIGLLLDFASLFITRHTTMIMGKDRQPIAPPISGPVADGFVAIINKSPLASFTLIAVFMFISAYIVFRK